MNEEWRAVKGYEGLYEVSNMGRVRSLDRTAKATRLGKQYELPVKGKMLTPHPRRHGYLGVQLFGKGGHKTRGMKSVSVHRLVAEAFIPNPNNLPEVNHKDEDKQNNRLDNLEWISHIDNTNYGNAQEKRVRRGADNPRSRPVAQYTRNGELVNVFGSMGETRRAGYAPGNIHKCIHGQYSHAYGYVWKYADE